MRGSRRGMRGRRGAEREGVAGGKVFGHRDTAGRGRRSLAYSLWRDRFLVARPHPRPHLHLYLHPCLHLGIGPHPLSHGYSAHPPTHPHTRCLVANTSSHAPSPTSPESATWAGEHKRTTMNGTHFQALNPYTSYAYSNL